MENCCPAPNPTWSQRAISDTEWTDERACSSCGHMYSTEQYVVPLRFPYNNRCVNCGGDQHLVGTEPRCSQCGLTASQDHSMHVRFAGIHPSSDPVAAADALISSNRYVLALKLATAAVRWGNNPHDGMLRRVQCLEAMELYDLALEESFHWVKHMGAPPIAMGTLASLLAATGDVAGALGALEQGLAALPERYDWWADHAELMMLTDDRPSSSRSAAKAIHGDDETRARAVEVCLEVAQRYYAEAQFAAALSTCSLMGDLQRSHSGLAWLRARILATQNDRKPIIEWLDVAVELDPENKEAKAMLESYRPSKRGWFSF